MMASPKDMRFVDIAVNLSDPMFQGNYRGKQLHRPDLEDMITRAKGKGVQRQIITGTSLRESKEALELARKHGLWSTAGCHPTSTTEIETYTGGADAYFADLESVIMDAMTREATSRLVSIGEIGLDYDRLYHAPKSTQLLHLPRLLSLSTKYNLPLFLHSRHSDAHSDLVRILKDSGWTTGPAGSLNHFQEGRGRTGVVHSFTGTVGEMNELLGLGLYVGINGCSLKTEENLAVVKAIPLERLMIETDSPWCSVTSTSVAAKYLPPEAHPLALVPKNKTFKDDAGVKGRNEPGDVGAIAYVISRVKGVPVEDVASAAWRNAIKVFFPKDADGVE